MLALAAHSGRLERLVGADQLERLSLSMKDWYGPPIPVGLPGRSRVYACKGGDFRGLVDGGGYATGLCWAADFWERKIRPRIRRMATAQASQLNVGFASLSDLAAAQSAGQIRNFEFNKAGATGVIGVTNSLWGVGNQPVAGANASNAPGGDALNDSNAAAPSFVNPGGTDTLHTYLIQVAASVAGNTLLMYDRLFQVNKTMNSTATEAVTGVPTRYQNTTSGQPDSAAGNFLFVEVGGTALAATAHNWTTCLYTDQNGNTGVTLPSLTGNSGAIVRRLDHPTFQWFAPLASGDNGILALTQMQCSAAVATGVINFVIGHPLEFIPIPFANGLVELDRRNKLTRIFDDAALGLLEITKPATTATTYNLHVEAAFS